MKFGRFDDTTREYVIETYNTPQPWINYLGTEEFYSIISNTAGGYCFYKDASFRRILRYRYNNVPFDGNGRYFYICDDDDYWNIGWKPSRRELDFYECRHGMGYTKIISERNGIRAKATFFVPLDENAEIHSVTISNKTSETKNLTLFSFVEFCLWNANDDMTNFQRNLSVGEVEIEKSAIFHKTEYRERRNHFAFYAATSPIDGFDTNRDTFLGRSNGYDSPDAVTRKQAFNSIAHGWAPIASHQINITLSPGSEKKLAFVLGYIENSDTEKWETDGVINKKKVWPIVERFSREGAVEAALDDLAGHWRTLLDKYLLNSHDPCLDRVVNIWNPYQCMVTFNLSRSASYFESGIGRGMGFRDSNQDLLGFMHQIPQRARQRILDLAAVQFENGSVYHQYQPLTKRGNHNIGDGFNDDPLWLIFSSVAYIKETGDYTILEELVPFDNNPENTASLMQHLRCSFQHVLENRGPHGLPLIGRADWNDCLNLNCYSTQPDEAFQTTGNKDGKVAESIFIAGMFVYIGPMYAELCRYCGLKEEAEAVLEHVAQMAETVIQHGYDGEWFLRAYDAKGKKVGSSENDEGKIFIEPQGMCVMAGIGVAEGLAEQTLNAVRDQLETSNGLVLVQPAFSKYDPALGEITSYPPGYKENAGIFCHNNPWVACAETVIGRGERAFEIYKKTAPAYIEERSDAHELEPYVYAQMIAGKDAATPGQAKNSWLTGAAAWNYVAITQWILGIKPEFDGLKIDPCIPPSWSGYTVTRHYREAVYVIEINNPDGVSHGIASITLDGKPVSGNILPDLRDGKEHQVIVRMGNP